MKLFIALVLAVSTFAAKADYSPFLGKDADFQSMFTRMQYLNFWQQATMTRAVDESHVASTCMQFAPIYYQIQAATGVPWYVICAIDYREENFNHHGYLGNGDPLDRPTTHVPRGRGPFPNWQAGAIDAIQVSGWSRLPGPKSHWDIVTSLMKTETYNGLGYANIGLRSPFVWSGTNMQQPGKFDSDGHFDPNAWDDQLGTASIFMALKKYYKVDLQEQ